MKIAVCAKQVPDTEVKVQVKNGAIDDEEFTYIVNPYDEYAVEEALRIKESGGDAEIVVFTIGGDRAKEAVRSCLAMGADRAVLLNDPLFLETDGRGRGMILAKAIEKEGFDLILCGKQAIDVDEAQTGIRIAEILGLPHVSSVNKIEWGEDGTFRANRDIEGGTEVVEAKLPAVLTATKGLNEPRYASLRGIMMSKKKPIAEMDAEALGLTADDLKPYVSVVGVELPPERKAGKTVSGDVEETVPQLIDFLKNEAKIL